jgi:hypothetical protein
VDSYALFVSYPTLRHRLISLFSCGSTASATGEKPEMIVECIGNKANGMAEPWTLEVASEAVHQQQPGEVPFKPSSLTSHAVTSVLSSMSLEFVFSSTRP